MGLVPQMLAILEAVHINMEKEIIIVPVNPETFEIQDYNTNDEDLLTVSVLDTKFSSPNLVHTMPDGTIMEGEFHGAPKDYIEYYIFDENENLIFPETTTALLDYNVKEGDVLLDPVKNLENNGFDIGSYFISYNFYRQRLASDIQNNYYISEISSDRTEVRLSSTQISGSLISSSAAEFINFRNESNYFVDFYLNFGSNQIIIANNLQLDTSEEEPTLLIKLYQPLPLQYNLKDTLWVVEGLSDNQTYKVTFPQVLSVPDDFEYISGPNFNINVKNTTGKSSDSFSYETLIGSDLTSSFNQIQSILNEKDINVNINYENFEEFTHFSSAKTRLENFYYKVGLIESASNQISFLNNVKSDTKDNNFFSSSRADQFNIIETTIKNFDGYEYFLYFNSGSTFSYPKSNDTVPYALYSTGSSQVLNWVGSADPNSPYYGGLALSASLFDESNKDYLLYSIPEYLRNDPDNLQYELFVDMIGQHFDNIYIYLKDVTNKFDGDNRINYGISKDLVAEAIKDFGVKLYSNNFNTNDLYTAFLGITPSGSLFPFPDITGSLPAATGFEYVDTKISASNDTIPLDDINKRVYKRIYHNIPYLLKTKGTIAGLRALITTFGIPDTILRINEFGGKDKNNSQDWDLTQNVFAKQFDTRLNDTISVFSSSFVPNFNFKPSGSRPESVAFRFKSSGIPTSSVTESLFLGRNESNSIRSFLTLDYNESLLEVGSYSGSINSLQSSYGTLTFYPDITNLFVSASLTLPFYNNEYWSVLLTFNEAPNENSFFDDVYTLRAANEINGDLGFNEIDSITYPNTTNKWKDIFTAFLPFNSILSTGNLNILPFSGSLQEVRYYTTKLSASSFYDFTVNPFSIEGNGLNSGSEELFFRASLGNTLDTASRTSIHPKVTGSTSFITSSFVNNSSFNLTTSSFSNTTYSIFQDQSPVGIKNRITDKIQTNDSVLAQGTASNTLSAFRSIQQTPYESGSYTPNVNYLEVAFSPQDQINDDINSQLGYFNIGNYIGDYRQISSSNFNYPDLDKLRNDYFKKYKESYNVKDFVRLIKFFDNSLFKMIKDFTPARTSLASGIVVKQHLLERNRQRPVFTTSSLETFTGSVVNLPNNFTTGSTIYKFSGGTGGSLDRYNGLFSSPSSGDFNLTNSFYLTQSFSESIKNSILNTLPSPLTRYQYESGSFLGFRTIERSTQDEFYNGEFSGSNFTVVTQSINPECSVYLKPTDTVLSFKPYFFNEGNINEQSVNNVVDIISKDNNPLSGSAYIVSLFNPSTQNSTVTHIVLSLADANGLEISDSLKSSDKISFMFNQNIGGVNRPLIDYFITGRVFNANNIVLSIDDTKGFPQVTGSNNGGSENWSLIAKGNINQYFGSDQNSQGVFTDPTTDFQNQYFYKYNGEVIDRLGFFNTGSLPTEAGFTAPFPNEYLNNVDRFNFGAYNPKRTSNTPWTISASVVYSSSDLNLDSGGGSGTIISSGSYHSGFRSNVFNFTLSSSLQTGSIFPLAIESSSLTSTFFNRRVNTNLPNNGSTYNAVAGGHPTLIEPITASFSFDIGDVVLSGNSSSPTTIPTVITNNWISTNSQNEGNFNNSTGVYSFNIDQFESNNFNRDVRSINLNYDITASIQNVTASLQRSTNGISFSTVQTTKKSGNSNITNNYIDSTFSGTKYYRLLLESPETSYNISGSELSSTIYVEVETYGGYFDFYLPDLEARYTSTFTQQTTGGNSNTGNVRAKLIHLSASQNSPIVKTPILITQSEALENVSIAPGSTLTFPDSTIYTSDIKADSGSMFYVEYEFTNALTPDGNQNVLILGEVADPKLGITASQEIAAGSLTYQWTGSLNLLKGNFNAISPTISNLTSSKFNSTSSASIGRFDMEYTYDGNFAFDDVYRMGFSIDKSLNAGLEITEYTMSIFPGTSSFTNYTSSPSFDSFNESIDTDVIIPTFLEDDVLEFGRALDCQPTLNNYNLNRRNSYIEEVDYNNITGSNLPVNFDLIINGDATRAQTPDSNYTSERVIIPRYKGSKSTYKLLNRYSPGDFGGYGFLPNVESKTAYFIYFNSLRNPYPNINDKIQLDISYLIDEQENAIPPSLTGIGLYNLRGSFKNGQESTISINSGSRTLKNLNGDIEIFRVGEEVTPILYSQTSSRSYSKSIPLSGSDRLSLYDDEDSADAFYNYAFTAEGTSSLGNNFRDQFPDGFENFEVILNPSEDINYLDGAPASTSTPPYGEDSFYLTGSDNLPTGSITFPDESSLSPSITGPDLSDNQTIFLETSVVTSFLYESGTIELDLEIQLLKGNPGNEDTPVEIELVDCFLIAHQNGQNPQNLGTLISSTDNVLRFDTGNGLSQVPRYNPKRGNIRLLFENHPLNHFLRSKGIIQYGSAGVEEGGTLAAQEFVIKVKTSNNHIFKQSDSYKWKLKGFMPKSKQAYRNTFFPLSYDGLINPTKISIQGARSYLIEDDNSGKAPFWVYSGSAGGNSNIKSQKHLVMSSSLINEAYGGSYFQGFLGYSPGPSEYFPGDVEISGSQFDTIRFPIIIEEKDEIRFQNNENYTYTIINIVPPQNNIEDDGKGRIKIELDREIPQSINKDFFVIRRYVPNPNSILLNKTFPYDFPPTDSSSPGILFPEFPVVSLQESSSAIISNLVSKGVIK